MADAIDIKREDDMEKMNYSVVRGNYFRTYTGTGTYTGLNVKTFKTLKEAQDFVRDDNEGLIVIIDLNTGLIADESVTA